VFSSSSSSSLQAAGHGRPRDIHACLTEKMSQSHCFYCNERKAMAIFSDFFLCFYETKDEQR
jgi:hypothetical protein